MLTLFPELELATAEQPTVSAVPKSRRPKKIRRLAEDPQLGLPFHLSAKQVRLLWMGGRGQKDPSAREIVAGCQQARDANEFLNDGRRRDGHDLAVLFAEAAIRHATQALHTWSRMWACRVDRQTEDDGGRAYRKILQQAWLAWEWIEETEPVPSLVSFRDACEVLSCRTEEVREGIYRGGLELCARRKAARESELADVEWIGEPGEEEPGEEEPDHAALSPWAMAWLGALAGIEESGR